jgi:hypothetical protein
MEGINAYSRPAPDGKGVTVDVERMCLDLITVMKASGATKEIFLDMVSRMFDEVRVDVRIPKRAKN